MGGLTFQEEWMKSTEEKSGGTGEWEGETTGIGMQNKQVDFFKKIIETFFINQIIFKMHQNIKKIDIYVCHICVGE